MHQSWLVFVLGLVLGIGLGWRLGTWYIPLLLGKMATWAMRGDIRRYKRRGRR